MRATHSERSTGRCRSTATGCAASGFIFLQLLGLSSAEEFDTPEVPSASSTLSVLAVVLAAGLVAFGEANSCLCDRFSLSFCLCLFVCLCLVLCHSFSTLSRPSLSPLLLFCPCLPLCSLSQLHPSLSAAQSMLIVWYAGVLSMGSAAEEAPAEVSAAD